MDDMILVSSREEITEKYSHMIKGHIAAFRNWVEFMCYCKRKNLQYMNSVTFYDKENEIMYIARFNRH